jgi:hypothetical protein
MQAGDADSSLHDVTSSGGTSLEQIAAESLTRATSDFVHDNIWRRARNGPQDRESASASQRLVAPAQDPFAGP